MCYAVAHGMESYCVHSSAVATHDPLHFASLASSRGLYTGASLELPADS